jgi:uracil-DNA glycosylase family 4
MIVGEAPGGEEDAQGLPFVGRAGKLLDKMLATIGLSRQENVFITNLIYWRPPGNRDPSPAEMQICAPFLARQIELKKPKLLLTAGKFATQAMLGTEDGIMRLRGRKLLYRQEGLPAPVKVRADAPSRLSAAPPGRQGEGVGRPAHDCFALRRDGYQAGRGDCNAKGDVMISRRSFLLTELRRLAWSAPLAAWPSRSSASR